MSKPASRRGFSVNVFLPTGDPEGLKVVEKSNWSGRGLVIPKAGFVVFAGSKAVGDDRIVPSVLNRFTYVKDLRDELIRQGVMAPEGQGFTFTQDYLFTAPSTAATALLGRTANGRIEWKTKDGRTLEELQEAEASG